ncbi:MAG: DUF1934 domain-containing protein [Oscillospiraceae bacterium]|jgi:uncharacterized beta-barrel protein YwiB (DUF1934 family)|nr:DUF1934 domain-containing protein [Oscillospiraceae bacterium]
MREILLTIKSRQQPDILSWLEPETVEITSRGKFLQEEDGYTIVYAGCEGSKCLTTLKFGRCGGEQEVITLIKKGSIIAKRGNPSALLVVKPGRQTNCLYQTKHGSLPVGILGESIHTEQNDSGGTLEYSYRIVINMAATNLNQVQMNFAF